jgi:sulfite reductase (NADPH) flavoprotein alpha-component
MPALVAAPPVYNKDNPFPAQITANRLLSRPGSGKEIRHFTVDIAGSGFTYKAGDSLGVYPNNRPSEVDEILQHLGATGRESVMLPRSPEPMTLSEALLAKLALSGPTRRMVETLAGRATEVAEKSRLEALLVPEAAEQLAAFLGERHFVDLLAEFPSARLAPQEFVDHLRRLTPRLYSIASSPKVFPHEIHLTVAVIRYRTNERDRVGVCSSFKADRVRVGETPTYVFVAESHFAPPDDGAKDCVMVGPGVGIAPFRAFLQDRVASGAPGRNWVFFGDQHRAYDFIYEDEWRDHLARGRVHRIDLAWSRDQAHKIYVQDKMGENAAELWAWLAGGAHFYVCGDARHMAKGVDAALHEIIARQGGMDAAAAAEYVKRMKKEKRYQRDVY